MIVIACSSISAKDECQRSGATSPGEKT